MKERTKTRTVYVCDNCGAEHSNKYEIMTDTKYGTGMEYCTKCAKEVRLANTEIFEVDGISDDIGSNIRKVPPKVLKAVELDLELDYADYVRKIYNAMELYASIVNAVEKEYMAGNIRNMKDIPTSISKI